MLGRALSQLQDLVRYVTKRDPDGNILEAGCCIDAVELSKVYNQHALKKITQQRCSLLARQLIKTKPMRKQLVEVHADGSKHKLDRMLLVIITGTDIEAGKVRLGEVIKHGLESNVLEPTSSTSSIQAVHQAVAAVRVGSKREASSPPPGHHPAVKQELQPLQEIWPPNEVWGPPHMTPDIWHQQELWSQQFLAAQGNMPDPLMENHLSTFGPTPADMMFDPLQPGLPTPPPSSFSMFHQGMGMPFAVPLYHPMQHVQVPVSAPGPSAAPASEPEPDADEEGEEAEECDVEEEDKEEEENEKEDDEETEDEVAIKEYREVAVQCNVECEKCGWKKPIPEKVSAETVASWLVDLSGA